MPQKIYSLLFTLLFFHAFSSAQVVNIWEHKVNHSGLKTEPFGLEIDSIGNSWILLQNEQGFNLQHYDSSGNTLWIAGLPVQDYGSEVRGFQLDQQFNSFVLVSLLDSDTLINSWHMCVIKYNASGNEIWRYFQMEPGRAGSMTLDDSGNVCIIGTTLDSLPPRLKITKINSNGNLLWSRNYSLGASLTTTEFYGIKIQDDGNGNLFICGGYYNFFPDSSQIAILKITSSGNIIWSQFYNFYPDNFGAGINFSYDLSQSLLVATENYDQASGLLSTIILHYDTSGNLVKVANPAVSANKIYQLSNGDYLQAGDVLQYLNSSDSVLWVRSYGNAKFVDIFVDRNNSIYLAGKDSDKYVFAKYSITGNLQWAQHYDDNGFAIFGSDARYIRSDAGGNVYVTGFISNSDHYGDGHTATLKYKEYNTSITDILTERINFTAFPNPANDKITLAFNANNFAEYFIKLTDISGQTMINTQGKTTIGINAIELELSSLANGLYLLHVRVGNENGIIKVIVR